MFSTPKCILKTKDRKKASLDRGFYMTKKSVPRILLLVNKMWCPSLLTVFTGKPLTRGCGPSATLRLLCHQGTLFTQAACGVGFAKACGNSNTWWAERCVFFLLNISFCVRRNGFGFFVGVCVLYEKIANENLIRNEDCSLRAKIVLQARVWNSLELVELGSGCDGEPLGHGRQLCVFRHEAVTHTPHRDLAFISSPSIFGLSLERRLPSSEEEHTLCCHCIALC